MFGDPVKRPLTFGEKYAEDLIENGRKEKLSCPKNPLPDVKDREYELGKMDMPFISNK